MNFYQITLRHGEELNCPREGEKRMFQNSKRATSSKSEI
jgi:hypothetical protein